MDPLKEGLLDLYEIEEARARKRARIEASGLTRAEYERRAWAKSLARSYGLAYWPALAYGPKVDPVAYRVAEDILVRKTGSRWGEILPDGSCSHGGWDSWGHQGTSAWEVANMWLAAGCRDGGKFRLQVLSSVVARKGDSLAWLRNYVRGQRWLTANGLDGRWRLGRKVVAVLGRLPWYCRWAAVSGLEAGQKKVVRVRGLNWAAVKVAQKGVRAAFKAGYIPAAGAWWHLAPDIAGLAGNLVRLLPVAPWELRLSTLRRVLAGIPGGARPEDVLPAVQLVRLFGADERAIWQYVGDGGSVHDAGQINLPASGLLPGWGGLLMQAPSMVRHLARCAEVQDLLGGRVPSSVKEWREAVAKLSASISIWAVEAGLSRVEEEDYERFFSSNEPKGFVGIPAPNGSNGLKLGRYHLIQLQSDDPVQVLAGRLVDCCQHLHGAAASCAKAAWTEGDAAIWAVYKGGSMVAQAFVWRSYDAGTLVLDSVECLKGHEESVAKVFLAAAKAVVGKMGVRRIAVGDNAYGASRALAQLAQAGEPMPAPQCSFELSYTDARSVIVICETDLLVGWQAAHATAIQAQRPAAEPVNALLEGSGVFCEYCDAEVHPECDICPVCGADIAEWVEEA